MPTNPREALPILRHREGGLVLSAVMPQPRSTPTMTPIPEDLGEDYLEDLAAEALSFARERLSRLIRSTGICAIVHSRTVGDALPAIAKPIGYLHDLMEAGVTFSDLLKFPAWVAERVRVLSRRKNEYYDEYILRVLTDEVCKIVKITDIGDNITDFIKPPTKERYRLALRMLGVDPCVYEFTRYRSTAYVKGSTDQHAYADTPTGVLRAGITNLTRMEPGVGDLWPVKLEISAQTAVVDGKTARWMPIRTILPEEIPQGLWACRRKLR